MPTIDLARLREVLAAVKGATPIGFVALTDARAKVTGNPYGKGGIRKLTTINAMTGTDFEASVRRQQRREDQTPSFEAGERQWGTRVSAALVEKDGSFYLAAQVNPLHKAKPLYLVAKQRGARTVLTAVPKSAVEQWLPADRTADEAYHQGDIARPVIYRNWRLDSLVSLSIAGKRYRIRRESPVV